MPKSQLPKLWSSAVRMLIDDRIDLVERSLDPFSDSIKAISMQIETAAANKNFDYLEAVIDDETGYIENLLGISFVICQSFITFIVSYVFRLHDACNQNNVNLSRTEKSKTAIMRLHSADVLGTKFSQVQVIDAFANYFKHSEEWGNLWKNISDRSKPTLEIISAIGAEPLTNGNFRTAAEVLGNPKYEDLSVFTAILKNWGLSIHSSYADELQSLGFKRKRKFNGTGH